VGIACSSALRSVGKFANITTMRRISWLKAALNDFHSFPRPVQDQMKSALEIATAGAKADVAKPMKGFDAGVYEIAVSHHSDAFRTIYALKLDFRYLGHPCFPEKVKTGNKDAKA
jgi:phage-related protein